MKACLLCARISEDWPTGRKIGTCGQYVFQPLVKVKGNVLRNEILLIPKNTMELGFRRFELCEDMAFWMRSKNLSETFLGTEFNGGLVICVSIQALKREISTRNSDRRSIV